jgi:hypothetical protein
MLASFRTWVKYTEGPLPGGPGHFAVLRCNHAPGRPA